jgi:hypothetical protein
VARSRTPPPAQQQPPPPEGHPVLTGVVATTLAAGGATVAALAPAAAPAAAAILTDVGLALGTKQVAKLVNTTIFRFMEFDRARRAQVRPRLEATARQQYPDLKPSVLDRLLAAESRREVEFRRKMRERLKRDLPKAAVITDPDKRRAKIRQILERERRIVLLRDQAMHDRVLLGME